MAGMRSNQTPNDILRESRELSSKVMKYEDDDLSGLRPFQYRPLKSMQRRIRLLRLIGGGRANPDITCELFEVEYGPDNEVQEVKRMSAQDHRPQMNDSRPASGSNHEREYCGHGNRNSSNRKGSRKTSIEYEALSWCWGSDSKDCGIRVKRGSQQFRLAATRELVLALKYLRRRDEDRILWIDALCINQRDREERNHQVQMMSLIYNCATQVCVWLGEGNDDSTMAFLFIREIMGLENFDAISENKENASKWQSLLLLMQRPWFSRRWVVQEIALARQATVYCGKDEIPWENFAVAVELFVEVETVTHRLSEVMQKTEAFGHVPQWFEHVSELGASVLVQATGKVYRRDGIQKLESKHGKNAHSRSKESSSTLSQQRHPGTPPRPLLSLEYLVSSLSVFQASQPRDAVYSLLAIARDTSPIAELSSVVHDGSRESIIMSTVSSFLERKPFTVDYSRAYSDVCRDFIAFCIKGVKASDPSRALDILCRPWAPEPETHGQGNVIHQKMVPYKFRKEKERTSLLKDPDKRKRRRQKNEQGEEVDDTRSLKEYFNEAPRPKDHDSWISEIDKMLKKVEPPKDKTQATSQHESTTDEEIDMSFASSDGESDDAERGEVEDLEQDMDLPSWVSRISGAAFELFRHPGRQTMLRMGRKNADPLVGLPLDGHRNYSAAQNKRVDYKKLKFRKRPVLGHHSLYVPGFQLDEILTVAEPARLGCIPETWTKMANWENAVDGISDPPAEFWRTLVADRGKDNRNPPYYYATACKESVRKGGLRGGSVDTGALISSERNSIIAEFCRRVQAVIWNRRLIRTKGGRLGLARQEVKSGDWVCIIYGCSVPVILSRGKVKTGEDIEKEAFEDNIEAMKSCLTLFEQSCFRRLRYKRAQKKAGRDNPALADLREQEIREELDVVNKQIESWNEARKAEERKKKYEDDEKAKRKEEASRRREAQLKKRQTMGLNQDQGSDQTAEQKAEAAKEEAKREDPYYFYKFIGEAYIHGMMDGEAIRQQMMDVVPERLFEIR